MDKPTLHLVKLCVGAETVDDLLAWQAKPAARGPDGMRRHVTRMWPKRGRELLENGSLYWVFKGQILCRQRILRLDEVIGADGIRRCGIVLDDRVVLTHTAPKRPFQGWRYLADADAPRDLSQARPDDDALPTAMGRALAEIGVL